MGQNGRSLKFFKLTERGSIGFQKMYGYVTSDSDTEDEMEPTQCSQDNEDLQSPTKIPASIERSKAGRKRGARNWWFEQFQISRFGFLELRHPKLKYVICQNQERQGYPVVYGLLVFTKQVSYACVHLLIGGGPFCNIDVAEKPWAVRLKCYSDDGTDTRESGEEPAFRNATSRPKRKRLEKNPNSTSNINKSFFRSMEYDDIVDDSSAPYMRWARKANK